MAVAWLTDEILFDKLCQKADDLVDVQIIIVNDEINRNSGIDYEKLIKPTFRDKKQFGWYIYFGNNKKVEFGGVHIDIESSKQMCLDFLKELKERITAKHLDAGSA